MYTPTLNTYNCPRWKKNKHYLFKKMVPYIHVTRIDKYWYYYFYMKCDGTQKETIRDNIARSPARTFIGVKAFRRGRPLPNPSRAFRRRTGGKSLATVLFHKGRPDPPSNPMNRNVILIHLITAASVYTRIPIRKMPKVAVKCLLVGRRGEGRYITYIYTIHLLRASR